MRELADIAKATGEKFAALDQNGDFQIDSREFKSMKLPGISEEAGIAAFVKIAELSAGPNFAPNARLSRIDLRNIEVGKALIVPQQEQVTSFFNKHRAALSEIAENSQAVEALGDRIRRQALDLKDPDQAPLEAALYEKLRVEIIALKRRDINLSESMRSDYSLLTGDPATAQEVFSVRFGKFPASAEPRERTNRIQAFTLGFEQDVSNVRQISIGMDGKLLPVPFQELVHALR